MLPHKASLKRAQSLLADAADQLLDAWLKAENQYGSFLVPTAIFPNVHLGAELKQKVTILTPTMWSVETEPFPTEIKQQLRTAFLRMKTEAKIISNLEVLCEDLRDIQSLSATNSSPDVVELNLQQCQRALCQQVLEAEEEKLPCHAYPLMKSLFAEPWWEMTMNSIRRTYINSVSATIKNPNYTDLELRQNSGLCSIDSALVSSSSSASSFEMWRLNEQNHYRYNPSKSMQSSNKPHIRHDVNIKNDFNAPPYSIEGTKEQHIAKHSSSSISKNKSISASTSLTTTTDHEIHNSFSVPITNELNATTHQFMSKNKKPPSFAEKESINKSDSGLTPRLKQVPSTLLNAQSMSEDTSVSLGLENSASMEEGYILKRVSEPDNTKRPSILKGEGYKCLDKTQPIKNKLHYPLVGYITPTGHFIHAKNGQHNVCDTVSSDADSKKSDSTSGSKSFLQKLLKKKSEQQLYEPRKNKLEDIVEKEESIISEITDFHAKANIEIPSSHVNEVVYNNNHIITKTLKEDNDTKSDKNATESDLLGNMLLVQESGFQDLNESELKKKKEEEKDDFNCHQKKKKEKTKQNKWNAKNNKISNRTFLKDTQYPPAQLENNTLWSSLGCSKQFASIDNCIVPPASSKETLLLSQEFIITDSAEETMGSCFLCPSSAQSSAVEPSAPLFLTEQQQQLQMDPIITTRSDQLDEKTINEIREALKELMQEPPIESPAAKLLETGRKFVRYTPPSKRHTLVSQHTVSMPNLTHIAAVKNSSNNNDNKKIQPVHVTDIPRNDSINQVVYDRKQKDEKCLENSQEEKTLLKRDSNISSMTYTSEKSSSEEEEPSQLLYEDLVGERRFSYYAKRDALHRYSGYVNPSDLDTTPSSSSAGNCDNQKFKLKKRSSSAVQKKKSFNNSFNSAHTQTNLPNLTVPKDVLYSLTRHLRQKKCINKIVSQHRRRSDM